MGGAVSALLVVIGEYAIARYLRSSAIVSIYGVAGSLVVLLLWIYYSSLIGAELTQAYAKCCGEQIIPSKFAEWTPEMAAKLRQQSQQQERKPPELSPPPHTEPKP